jgi:hypothetical protein
LPTVAWAKTFTEEAMAEERPSILTGGFRDRDSAELAYASLLMSDETRNRHFANDPRRTELGTRATGGMGARAVAGGGLGALLVGPAASGIAVPSLPIIAMGALAAALLAYATVVRTGRVLRNARPDEPADERADATAGDGSGLEPERRM